MLMAGVNVPYSAEYRDRESNLALITALARLTPKGGEPGRIIEGELEPGKMDALLDVDTFRHNLPKARSSQDVWPLLVLLAASLFFFDVFVRRVSQIGRVIVGHDEIVHGVLTCLFVGGHCLLEGVPGLGKTLLVRTLARR
jgi:hypothetical protein